MKKSLTRKMRNEVRILKTFLKSNKMFQSLNQHIMDLVIDEMCNGEVCVYSLADKNNSSFSQIPYQIRHFVKFLTKIRYFVKFLTKFVILKGQHIPLKKPRNEIME